MKVTVFGLGYVGCVTSACLAEAGHRVTGIDLDKKKVKIISLGRSPIIEPGLDGLIARTVAKGRLRTENQVSELGDVSLVCVGTPSQENGSLSLEQLLRVTEQIGELLGKSKRYQVINFRSTVLPGTVEDTLIPLLEKKSGKKAGTAFGVCMNPEFLRETTAVTDFHSPPFTVIGSADLRSAEQVAALYSNLTAPVERTTIRTAEMIKYVCNTFHATKICFANEIGNICKRLGIDSHKVMDVFCKDTKLNLSSYYLKPGFAFGGSCLPKDLRAILYMAKHKDLEIPMLHSLLESNQKQIESALSMITSSGGHRVGVLGLSFKAGTDDLRESPMVLLTETLLGKGYKVTIYDHEVSMAKLFGANKRYIERTIPHISSLLVSSPQEAVDQSDTLVVGKKDAKIQALIASLADGKTVIDLARIVQDSGKRPMHYEGICW